MRRLSVILLILCGLTLGAFAQSNVNVQRIYSADAAAQAHVTVSTSATKVVDAGTNRRSVLIQNQDASITIWLGDSSVTNATGIRLLAGQSIAIDVRAALYAIADSSTVTVGYFDEIN